MFKIISAKKLAGLRADLDAVAREINILKAQEVEAQKFYIQLANELEFVTKAKNSADDINGELRSSISNANKHNAALKVQVAELEVQLGAAQKNDARDKKGKYTRTPAHKKA